MAATARASDETLSSTAVTRKKNGIVDRNREEGAAEIEPGRTKVAPVRHSSVGFSSSSIPTEKWARDTFPQGAKRRRKIAARDAYRDSLFRGTARVDQSVK